MSSQAACLADLTGDYRAQAEFVVDAAWRVLSLQDGNVLSPSYGCFHYPYWRDKTSEFPDARCLMNIADISSKTSLLYCNDADWLQKRLAPCFLEAYQCINTLIHSLAPGAGIKIPIHQRKQILKKMDD